MAAVKLRRQGQLRVMAARVVALSVELCNSSSSTRSR
jgi:hypothetical protein